MTDLTIAGLLHEAAETHHVVFRIVDGDDPDWASWYADWLLDLSELPDLLGRVPVRSHLVSCACSARSRLPRVGVGGTLGELVRQGADRPRLSSRPRFKGSVRSSTRRAQPSGTTVGLLPDKEGLMRSKVLLFMCVGMLGVLGAGSAVG